MNPAVLAAFAFSWWGFVPIYWKQIAYIPASESIHYRILFSCFFIFLILKLRSKITRSFSLFKTKKEKILLPLSALFIGLNWYFYVWAINNHQIVEASLGYFINPLVNILLGIIFFRERMQPLQMIACILATIGVSIITWQVGKLPWISLGLAFTFAFYGLCRKMLNAPTVEATFLETLLLSPISIFILIFYWNTNALITNDSSHMEYITVALSGVITIAPLLSFAEAAKHLTLSALGFFQFIAPSIQFLLGVFLYKENFNLIKLSAFSIIWLGLSFFLLHLFRSQKENIN